MMEEAAMRRVGLAQVAAGAETRTLVVAPVTFPMR
jgi:hypothetical protein